MISTGIDERPNAERQVRRWQGVKTGTAGGTTPTT